MHRYAAFAIGVLRDIYAFHRYTTHSAYLSHTLAPQFQWLDKVEPNDLHDALTILLPNPYTHKSGLPPVSSLFPLLL